MEKADPLINAVRTRIDRLPVGSSFIGVTKMEFNALMADVKSVWVSTFDLEKPKPPVKRNKKSKTGSESIEFDNDSPEYIRELIEYKAAKRHHDSLVDKGYLKKAVFFYCGLRVEVMQ
jgi:hypothetical protein